MRLHWTLIASSLALQPGQQSENLSQKNKWINKKGKRLVEMHWAPKSTHLAAVTACPGALRMLPNVRNSPAVWLVVGNPFSQTRTLSLSPFPSQPACEKNCIDFNLMLTSKPNLLLLLLRPEWALKRMGVYNLLMPFIDVFLISLHFLSHYPVSKVSK